MDRQQGAQRELEMCATWPALAGDVWQTSYMSQERMGACCFAGLFAPWEIVFPSLSIHDPAHMRCCHQSNFQVADVPSSYSSVQSVLRPSLGTICTLC